MSDRMNRVAVAATIGTTIEWYDFFIYGTAAALVFNKLFFPQMDPLAGTLFAFGTSATGFFARPIGAVVAGHFGDRIGRKALLMTTLLLMGGATVFIGLLPTYQTIGIAAPILLLVLRILQGFATGGEWGGAALMIVEHAGEERRGFWGSLVTVGIMLGLVLAALVFNIFALLPEQSFLAWGWRIPFLASAILVGLGFYMRLGVKESPAFQKMETSGEKDAFPIIAAVKALRSVLTIFFIRIAENFSFYIFSAFSLAYASTILNLPRTMILNAVIVAGLAECVTSVLFGILADKIGSRSVLLFGLLFQAAFAFPFFWLLESRSSAFIFGGLIAGLGVANGAISSVQPDYFSRFFPANIRYSGISLGREGATVIGAGLAPVVATALVAWAHASWPVSLCMLASSLVALIIVGYRRSARRDDFSVVG